MQRRTLLKLGLASGATLALVAGSAALFYEAAWRDGQLTAAGRSVLRGVARAVLDGSLPEGQAEQQAALTRHLEHLQATLQALPPPTQAEVGELLAVLALPAGRWALAGLASDWPHADVAQIQAALQAMRGSRLALRRQVYHALRDLTHAAYFADSAQWARLGYPGPMPLG